MSTPTPIEWLGLESTNDPHRWSMPVASRHATSSEFLFGGAGLGAAITALEAGLGRPTVWATAQYAAHARVGATVQIELEILHEGPRTTQARAISRVDDDAVIVTNAALGRRDLDLFEVYPTLPPVTSPDDSEPHIRTRPGDSIFKRMDQRYTRSTGEDLGGPTGHGPGRVCMWNRAPDDMPTSTATLAILGDFVANGISRVTGRSLSSNSLDNTLRVIDTRPTDWYLLEIEISSIRNGFCHGDVHVWTEDGNLLAVASQSLVVRERRD